MRRSYFFVRHGQAIYQERGFDRSRYPPELDWPLSSLGEAQAHALAPRLYPLGVERVVSSKLARARRTAEILSTWGGAPYDHTWGALNEIHPTRLREGMADVEQTRWSWMDGWRAARVVGREVREGRGSPGWDSRLARERIDVVLGRLDALREARIAVVGHGFWILLAALLARGQVPFRFIANCSVTRIDADGAGRYRLVSFASVL